MLMAQQVSYTAKDTVPVYTDFFRPGVNMGYFPPYADEDLANIAAGNSDLDLIGVGAKAMRPGLYDEFTSVWGYDSRLATYQHFYDLGLRDLTCIVGFPAEWHREHWVHCSDGLTESEMFANIYQDIWDDGTDGTPYNDENYYAAYLYEIVSRYKDYIEFWEIWNEPGFDYTGARGWLPPGWEGNWWENDPDPCDYKLRAPIQFYVRTLRISWEIIKTLDPDSYVCMAGVGFPSFLDAVLRNTDNIDGGQVTAEFPHRGGAYFDVMGFHSYPDIDGSVRYWSNEIGGFVYTRHSDAAVGGIERRKNTYQAVLDNYGYDGITYPKKEWIITEINIPRRAFNSNSMGDQEAQLNYILKAYVKAMENDIRQMHIYNLVDIEREEAADYEYDLMGLYRNIENETPYATLQMNPEGIAYKTGSDLLYGTRYDKLRTAAMNMGDDIDGGAFRNADGTYTYVLWATTSEDQSEAADAVYSFPEGWNIATLDKRIWDYSETNESTMIAPDSIVLDSRPIFVTESELVTVPLTANFENSDAVGCVPLTVSFEDLSLPNVDTWEWSFPGGTPATSSQRNPEVVYDAPGTYEVSLLVSNSLESTSVTIPTVVQAFESPVSNFMVEADLKDISLTNLSENASSYLWNFGDDNFSTEENPTHTYAEDGTYTIGLVATNGCGSITLDQQVTIVSVFAPEPSFSANVISGCAPLEVTFSDESINEPTSWLWFFSNGMPASSNEQNPTVVFEEAGTYTVVLQAGNEVGNNTIIQEAYVEVIEAPQAEFTAVANGSMVTTINTSSNANSYLWDFGDGTTSTEQNPSHMYAMDGTYTITLTLENGCSSSTATQILAVSGSNAPQAAFSFDTGSGCAPLEVQFTDASSANPDSWSWIFEGGTPSNSDEQNPVVTYAEAGVYEVTLFVSNDSGTDFFTQSTAIEVLDNPTAGFGAILQNNIVTFNNQSEGATSYLWDFGDGNTSAEESPMHSYLEDGTYTIELTVENSCGAVSTNQTVNITGSNAPQAVFTTDVVSGCAPLEIQFTDMSPGNPDAWLWIFDGGEPSLSNDQNPSVTYAQPGIYQVTLSVSNGSGTNAITESALIEVFDEEPVAFFSSFIVGDSVVFNNMSTQNAGYLWDFGDGNTSTELHPVHTYADNGAYEVSLLVSNPCGNMTYTDMVAIVGADTPNANFSANVVTGCAPLEVQFTDETTLDPTSWTWLFPGGTPAMSNDQNPVVTYESAGTYEVTLSVSNPSGNDVTTKTSYIHIAETPIAGFEYEIQGDTVVFNNTTEGDAFILWSFGDASSSNEINPTHIYPEAGMYDVTIWVNNECGADSYEETINIQPTSTEDLIFAQSVMLYPNPNNGAFTIFMENDKLETIEISIYNIIGQRLHQEQFAKNSRAITHNMELSNLASGTYLVQLKAENVIATKRIIVR